MKKEAKHVYHYCFLIYSAFSNAECFKNLVFILNNIFLFIKNPGKKKSKDKKIFDFFLIFNLEKLL